MTDHEAIISATKAAVCRVFGVPIMALDEAQTREACDAKKALIWFLRDVMMMKWKAIARAVGRDHSTAIHHRRDHFNFMETDPIYAARIERLKSELSTT